MSFIGKIKQKLDRCDNCWKKAEYHFSIDDVVYDEDYEEHREVVHYFQYCYEHAQRSGFCLGCGGFWGGVESFDMSRIKGYCSDCVDELEHDMGIGEYYGDMDYYDDYGHDFSEKQPNQSSTPNCPSCNSDLVQEEGHEFGDPDGEETGIIDHFHCTDCGQDFLKDGTKLVKHSETSLVAKEEK